VLSSPAVRRRRLRVGILDLLTTPARSWAEAAYDLVFTKQYGSITPQAIAVWSRRLGHATFYATYHGVGDPRRRLPRDLDVVFVATYTQASPLAYALAKLWRREGALTVVGGPHARSFPRDCLRFFDVAVGDCDRALVEDILSGAVGPGTFVASRRPFADVPLVEERMPELRRATFAWGRRPFFATTIPLLASTGCPYACDFCIDWDTPYRQLPLDRLSADLRYLATRLPGVMYGFHDPNFAVRFDEVLDVMETVPPAARNPYVMETSLSILRGARVPRLGASGCVSVAPGIESWAEYSPKAGVGRATGAAKVDRLVEHFSLLHEHVPYLQANFLFGVDADRGDEPVTLTRAFMDRTPFVWPVVNIPYPFGGTPFFARCRAEGRILAAMPFAFYYSPYLTMVPRHYGPVEYYERLVELFAFFTAPAMLARRLASTRSAVVRLAHVVRTRVKRRRLGALRRLLRLLREDRDFRAFHEGEPLGLPEFYQREYERLLGPFAALLSRAERVPVLEPLATGSEVVLPGEQEGEPPDQDADHRTGPPAGHGSEQVAEAHVVAPLECAPKRVDLADYLPHGRSIRGSGDGCERRALLREGA
jgi:hypothetical protein